MALDSVKGIMNCGTGERVERAGTGETSETGGTSGTGREL